MGGLSVAAMEGIARALDARLEIRLLWHGAEADRLLDAEHAGIVDAVVRRLSRAGWAVTPELTFNVYGERGSIDVLARHPDNPSALVIEVKTAIGDVQAAIAAHDRKVRLAPRLVGPRGSGGFAADRLLVVAGTRTARRHVDAHAATFRAAYPDRDPDVRRWLAHPGPRAKPLAGLIFVTPTRHTGDIGRQRVRVKAPREAPRSGERAPTGRRPR